MIRREVYRFQEGRTPLSAQELNRRFFDLDTRLDALEGLKVSWEEAVRVLQEAGLARINQVLLPLQAEAHSVASAIEDLYHSLGTWPQSLDPDMDGFLTPERIRSGSGSLTYDDQGNLTGVTQNLPDGRTLEVQLTYDANGNLVSVVFIVDGTPLHTLQLTYDAQGNLTGFEEV